MAEEVKIPEIGESINEGFLAEWLVEDGAVVEADAELLVLETDKVTINVTADVGGSVEILVEEGATVEVGQVVARIDPDAAGDEKATGDEEAADTKEPDAGEPDEKPSKNAAPDGDGERPDRSGLSPAVRRLVEEHDLDPSDIEGSGKDGRILKGDVLAHLDRSADQPEPESGSGTRETEPEKKPARAASAAEPEPAASGERESRQPMSRLRRRLAERLVQVQQTAAILTTFNEVDMSRVIELRSQYKADFEKRHGVGLGFMSFFVKAVVDALTTVPAVNAFIVEPGSYRSYVARLRRTASVLLP